MIFIPDYSSSADMNHEYGIRSIKGKNSFQSMVLSRVHVNQTTLEIQHYAPFILSKTLKQTRKHVQNISGEVAPAVATYIQNLGRTDSAMCRIKNENKNAMKQQSHLGVIFCITCLKGNCFQVQFTVQIDRRHNIPVTRPNSIKQDTARTSTSLC
jgi:hypothetical protein